MTVGFGVQTNPSTIWGKSNLLRVLLVEDQPADVEIFRFCLEKHASIRVAWTGTEAFDIIFRRGTFASLPRPHLIVLDLNVPLLTGHELLNAVKAHSTTCDIPVIVWSGSDHPGDIRKAYQVGACAYLVKTSSLEDMEGKLTALADFWLRSVRFPD